MLASVATMENGMNIPPPHQQQYHLQQQYQHQHPQGNTQMPDFYGYAPAPHHPPQSIVFRPPSTSVGSTSSTVSSASSALSAHKRGRVGSEASSTSVLSFQPQKHQQQFHPSANPPIVQVVQYAVLQHDHDDVSQMGSASTPKKARASNYQPPRVVKPSLLTAMGTLANPYHNHSAATSASPFLATNNNNSHVPMRRRLSGGHLEEYLGNHNDTMDGMDTSGENRPRSMSF
ncbi:hypothetical protein IV203_000725 [Nitzschia inconspicua]|uniref:Uncharacterized protein n=1 Tax=Nitzschia inconspicua TaxID=303405 RepID=A0A9K3PSU3_9STRA|nr:hypothetical protein IV203_000725 [Nitzschia inconspicua]